MSTPKSIKKRLYKDKNIIVTEFNDPPNITLITLTSCTIFIEDALDYIETRILIKKSHLKESFLNTLNNLSENDEIVFRTMKGE